MSDPLAELQIFSKELRRAAPRTFDDFLNAFRVLEGTAINALLAAGPDAVLSAQGNANAIRRLRQMFEKQ